MNLHDIFFSFFSKPPKDCQEGLTRGWTSSGVYTISPDGSSRVNVSCEQELDGGGWTVSFVICTNFKSVETVFLMM